MTGRVEDAAAVVRERAPGQAPAVGVVLGSGLGAFADTLAGLVRIPYADLPGMPGARVPGHAGNLCLGAASGVPIACLQGRAHAYEGHPPEKVVFGVRLLAALGCRAVLLTNAAGGIGRGLAPGDLLLLRDHLNLMGSSPLVGPNDPSGPRFPDLTHAYSPPLRAAARAAAAELGLELREGVYAAMLGPAYETPAEVRMLARLGADAVGMSTVPEVIALAHLGVPVAAVSCITNLAAGISERPLAHAEVEEVARRTRDRFSALLGGWIARVPTALAATDASAAGAPGPEGSLEELLAAARAAREHAHAPYSGFRVGAAIRGASGAVYRGCNVENASFGATICAERGAVMQLVAAGEARLTEVAVFVEGGTPAMPCGVCRQVLWELGAAAVRVISATPSARRETTLGALLPEPFELAR
ncbi:MAG: purine-nucleoside phosphorylase [Polyangiaceae bacterium]|nr:purine-nucleoside phosphorylase [Polyangiaceae bacterium]